MQITEATLRLGGPARAAFEVEACHGCGVLGEAVGSDVDTPSARLLRRLRSRGTSNVAGGSSRAALPHRTKSATAISSGTWLGSDNVTTSVRVSIAGCHWRGASLASVFDPVLSKKCCLVGSPTDPPIPFTQPGTVTFRMSLSWPIGSSPLRYCAWYWRDSGLPATRLARVST